MPDPDTPSRYFVSVELRGKLVVVLGKGSAAERRARTLLRHGPDLVVVSTDPTPTLIEAEADGVLTIERRPYVRGDLERAFMAVCVSDSEEERRAVASEAAERGCLVHVAGAPELSSYSVPAVMRRGRLELAISTGGVAPAVAKQVRARLQEEFGEEWSDYLSLLAELRRIAAERLPGGDEQARMMIERIADSDTLDRLAAGEKLDAEALYEHFAADLGTDERASAGGADGDGE